MSKMLIAAMIAAVVAIALLLAVVVVHSPVSRKFPGPLPPATRPTPGHEIDAIFPQSEQPTSEASPTLHQELAVTDQTAKPLAYAAASDEQAALETLERQANQGTPAAEYGMGLYLLTNAQKLAPGYKCANPWNENHLPEKLKRRLKKWDYLAPGNGEIINICLEAMSWLEKAAVSGDHCAQAELGAQYVSAANITNLLAQMYGEANNIPPAEMDRELNKGGYRKAECSEGLRWLNLAAAAHESSAESTLAIEYLVGLAAKFGCLPGNKLKAIEWDKKAYEDGNVLSTPTLATLYWDRGQFAEARKWINKAEKEGANDSETAWLIVNYYKGSDTNDDKAEYWNQRALQLDAEKEAKYPAFKLIHQKWMEEREQQESP